MDSRIFNFPGVHPEDSEAFPLLGASHFSLISHFFGARFPLPEFSLEFGKGIKFGNNLEAPLAGKIPVPVHGFFGAVGI